MILCKFDKKQIVAKKVKCIILCKSCKFEKSRLSQRRLSMYVLYCTSHGVQSFMLQQLSYFLVYHHKLHHRITHPPRLLFNNFHYWTQCTLPHASSLHNKIVHHAHLKKKITWADIVMTTIFRGGMVGLQRILGVWLSGHWQNRRDNLWVSDLATNPLEVEGWGGGRQSRACTRGPGAQQPPTCNAFTQSEFLPR